MLEVALKVHICKVFIPKLFIALIFAPGCKKTEYPAKASNSSNTRQTQAIEGLTNTHMSSIPKQSLTHSHTSKDNLPKHQTYAQNFKMKSAS